MYVTTQNAYLHKEGQSVVVNVEKETRLRVPVHTLDGIVCFGAVSMSPFLMHHCAEANVAVSFLSQYGKFLARIQSPVSGNVLLRRGQYRVADDPEKGAGIARNILVGKLANARAVIRRAHPYLEEKCKVGLLPHLQARLLARHLRGDLEAYPPFIWR